MSQPLPVDGVEVLTRAPFRYGTLLERLPVLHLQLLDANGRGIGVA